LPCSQSLRKSSPAERSTESLGELHTQAKKLLFLYKTVASNFDPS
jgi:hypothetical protein